MSLDARIEAILFYKGEPVSHALLARILGVSSDEISAALHRLEKRLEESGLRLMRKDEQVMLSTAPENASVIESFAKEDLTKPLGNAGLETLAIILYRGPLSRSAIDYIRGVNSQYVLRTLLIRGLIEKSAGKEGERALLYRPTFDLLSHLGLASLEELPEYSTVRSELEIFETTQEPL